MREPHLVELAIGVFGYEVGFFWAEDVGGEGVGTDVGPDPLFEAPGCVAVGGVADGRGRVGDLDMTITILVEL